MKPHHYSVELRWTGNLGKGTNTYTAYSRNHEILGPGKPVLPGSSDPAFRGDRSRYNPEELLVASLSACHMLWYLHLCAENGIVVTDYQDSPSGTMAESPDGSGAFTGVTLRPVATVAAETDEQKARALHEEAHQLCFIANSVKFPVRAEPRVIKASQLNGVEA